MTVPAETPAPLAHRLAAFLPTTVTRHLLQRTLPPLGHPHSQTAATLFADISGFTAMSEELATDGPRGAEEVNRVLLLTFTAMIDLIHDLGGAISHFYGDAMSVYFPEERGTAAQAALGCAQMMQRLMSTSLSRVVTNRPRGKRPFFELTIKIGVGYGSCQEIVVGDYGVGMEHVLTGEAVDEAAEAERYARAGQVVVSRSVLVRAGLNMLNPEGEKFLLLKTAVPMPPLAPLLRWQKLSESMLAQLETAVAPFVPAALIDRLQTTSLGAGEIAEHRPVTSIFVQFTFKGNEDPTSAIETEEMGHFLQNYYLWASELVIRFGRLNARVNRVLTGDKGNQLHIIFGAPVAPDSPDQALRLALAMIREQPSFVASQRIGLAAGKVFAGPVGSEVRREYTVVGDVVNLSARLMQQAQPGMVLTDGATARRVEGVIAFEELPPVLLKGKQEPVALYRAVSDEAATTRLQAYVGRQQRPLIGRNSELALLLGGLEAALQGTGGTAIVYGGTGSGKTRLVAEGVKHWLAAGGQGLVGICHQHTSDTPFGPWRTIWQDFFGLRLESDAATQVETLLSRLRVLLPGSENDAYLWGEVMGLPLSLPPHLAELTAEARQQRFFVLMRHVFLAAAAGQPMLIILENAHWADQSSLDLVDDLAQHLEGARIFVVLTLRPLGQLSLALWERPNCIPIIVSDLSPLHGRDLLTQLIGVHDLPAAVEQQLGLRDREGRDSPVNPLFLEEAIKVMKEAGVLVVNGRITVNESLLGQLQVPDTIHGLLLARLDRLTAVSRDLLQIASVIGRQFSLEPLIRLSFGLERQLILEMLSDLSTEEITRLVAADPEWVYLFQHALTHEVAYESMPYARRQQLHAAMADWLVARFGENLKPLYPTLAYHYSRADIHEEGLRYALSAAEDARAIFANKEAVELYTLAEKHLLALGEAANWETAVDLWLARAECLRLLGDFSQAVNEIETALTLLNKHKDAERKAQALNLLADVNYRLANYEKTITVAQLVLAEAQAISSDELARAYLWVGMAQAAQQAYSRALENLQRAEKICEVTGNNKRMAQVLEGIAFSRYMQRDLEKALKDMQRSVALSKNFSKPINTASALNNIGLLQFTLGRAEEALSTYEEAIEIVREVSRNFLAYFLSNRAEVLAYLGDYRQALADFKESVQLFEKMDDQAGLIEAHIGWGLGLDCALKEWQAANAHFDTAANFIGSRVEDFSEEYTRLLIGRAQVCLAAKNYDLCLNWLTTAAAVIEKYGIDWWKSPCYFFLAVATVKNVNEQQHYLEIAKLAIQDGNSNPDYLALMFLFEARFVETPDEKLDLVAAGLAQVQKRSSYAVKVDFFESALSILAELREFTGDLERVEQLYQDCKAKQRVLFRTNEAEK